MSPAKHPQRPGGRSARVRDAVYTAVGQLMGEGRPDRLTIPMVAQRAEVNPTSVYRRWGDIDTLLEEVSVAALTREGDEPPDTGSISGDLTQWAQIIVDDITRPQRTRYLRAMVSAREAVESCPCWEQRRGQAKDMLARGIERGEVAPTEHQVLDHVIAPLYHHVVFGLPTDRAYAERLVGDVLAMARPADKA
ncbi:TetR-like C-terminal domain-containing protein [Luteipulveratus mongoliensis]|uniref:TetR family transcriptional regulator n=1 Tax=Luteipulveratus mongoliensis TaxID=571913 RepID=A0A0K1JHK5_9MICO|nr:TetR-like C-terminal domain-containing protein [Luteipulveratus mongoliensis]AKU16075.1 TetR family transcriptional regulator [Luteipulveratus mongoliensis]